MSARRSHPALECRGLVVEVGPSTLRPARAFDTALEVVAETLPGTWGVEPLAGHDFLVTRWNGRPVQVGKAWELSAKLAAERRVRSAEPAFRSSGLEPEFEAQELAPDERTLMRSGPRRGDKQCAGAADWSLTLQHVQEAWKLTPPRGGLRRGAGIVIGHPDTGYTRHPEIWEDRRLLPELGYDFEDERGDPRDPLDGKFEGHGTSTASVIMSDHDPSDDAKWMSGVAPEARLIPYRVSDSVIHFDFTNVTRAIESAALAGAHVISMSLGGPFCSRFLERAIDAAIEKGVIILCAAGNVWPWVVYPARYEQVIAVAAVDCEKKPWSKSASGSTVDIAAPGESVWRASAGKERGTRSFDVAPSSGTSYAVANAAGACACWLAFHGRDRLIRRYGAPNLAAVFRELLVTRGFERPRGWGTGDYGAGILRLDRLLRAPLPDGPPGAGLERAIGRGPAPRAQPLDELAQLVPSLTASGLRRGLEQVLRTGEDELAVLLAEHGDELVVQLATDPVFRSAVLRAGSSTRRRSLTRGGRSAGRRMSRPETLSRALREKLGLRR